MTGVDIALLLTVIALIASVVGLLLTYFQLYQAKSHSKSLQAIHEAISTRFVGEFPNYIDDIVKLVQSAHSRIDIFCDFPNYAAFSAPRDALRFQCALQSKAMEIDVHVTCLSRNARQAELERQFEDELRNWEQWKGSDETKRRLREALGYTETEIAELTGSLFLDALHRDDQQALERMKNWVHIREVDTDLPLHFWLIDDREAIFSIASVVRTSTEFGFRTSDRNLINALNDMRQGFMALKDTHVDGNDVAASRSG